MSPNKHVVESLILLPPSPPDRQTEAEPRPDVGEILHSARRRRRISIKRAAQATYIPAEHLGRLEAGDLGFLSPVYVRSFLREYATYLKIDPTLLSDVLDDLEREEGDEAAILAESERHFAPRRAIGRRVGGGLAVVAALLWVISLIPGTMTGQGTDHPSTPRAALGGAAAEPAEDSSELGIGEAGPGTTAPANEGISLEVASSTASCWIEVVADGRIIFSDTIDVGDVHTFRADERMSIRLGFPGGVEMTVNGVDVGSPGGQDPITLALPRDLKSLERRNDRS